MQNINEILTGLGIEVPEDKTEELGRLVAANYKTVAGKAPPFSRSF